MLRFKRRGTGFSKIDELSPEHFGLRKTTCHGFPDSPSALGYDSETGFLMIGRKNGEFRVYGQPGVEFKAVSEVDSSIIQIHSFGNLHQYITVHRNSTVLLWQLGEEGGPHSLKMVKQFQLDNDRQGKGIAACCLAKLSGHFYIGTEGGNVFTLDVRLFELKDQDVVLWEKATGLHNQTTSSKNHPGSVVSIAVCPSNQNRILIGYEKGIMALWNIASSSPERNYFISNDQSLASLSWQHQGNKFISAYSDSSICFWNVASSTPYEGPTKHYGETCAPIKKISWLNSEDKPAIIFTGGLPYEDTDDHNTVTVLQGNEHVALDFTSDVIDYVPVIDSFTKRVQSLIVLCEQEIMAFDLAAPKCPLITKPCLYSIHASPVTCLKIYDNVPKELLQDLNEITLSNSASSEYISASIWPVTGGSIRLSDPPTSDILITGHANGSVKLWDVTGTSMQLVLELKTAPIFSTADSNELDTDMFSEFTWPPYRKVSSYDPFEDDGRLSIKFIELCPHTRKLCIGGEGGQVVSFALNPAQADVRVASVRAEIFMDESSQQRGNRLRGLRDSSPLESKGDFITMPAGFQPSFCVQLIPATPITALAFRPSWGLIAAANSKGFCVANFYTKSLILIHPTVLADGLEPRNISKVQSMRRSLRSSLRRRATIASANEERRKIVQTLNLEMGIHSEGASKSPLRSGGDKRSFSADANATIDGSMPVQGGVSPEQRGHVTHLLFAETHVSSEGPSVGIMACTMGSTIIRYSIDVPKNDKKFSESNRAIPAGKDYSLVHAAPIVAVFILDHEVQSLPSPAEVEHRVSPAPNMASPHYAIIVTQEQIKIISLPSLKSKRKEKFYSQIHERIFKAWIIKAKVPAAPVGASRDWNNALCILTTIGHLVVYSLPDLKLTFHKELYINPSDQKALQSLAISQSGEMFHLCSFSEIERGLLCSYNFSYHTSLMPSISSTHTPQRPRDTKEQQQSPARQVLAEVNTNVSSSSRVKSLDSQSSTSSQNITSEQRSIRSDSVRKSPGVASIEADKRKTSASQSTTQLPLSGGSPPPQPPDTLLSPKDKAVMASASAFTQVLKSRSPSLTSSSSSSDSESDSDSDDDNNNTIGETFGNPAAMADFGENKELDNIIASSLQQLENARAFYAQMQEKARSKPN